jgi:hypothetical protein
MNLLYVTPCDRCGGSGLTLRLRRVLSDGSPDPTDTLEWPQETCNKCGGGGMVQYDPGTVATE